MMLVIFVKKSLVKHVKEVAAEHVGTGIMGKMVRFHAHSERLVPQKQRVFTPIMSPFPARARISSSHLYQHGDETDHP